MAIHYIYIYIYKTPLLRSKIPINLQVKTFDYSYNIYKLMNHGKMQKHKGVLNF